MCPSGCLEVIFYGQSYREGVVFLPVQWPLAPNDSRFIINLKEVLGLLVHPWSLQLVDHLPCKYFVRLDLDGQRRRGWLQPRVEVKVLGSEPHVVTADVIQLLSGDLDSGLLKRVVTITVSGSFPCMCCECMWRPSHNICN